ncbi:MAG: hypothetical protein JW783_14285 [Bacteroidales bacterium]|nr:hypothetical protein [Bacteroidales bacterium]MBN2749722.1 hypothetical protein [Bacteroidales bacterium]
MPIKDYQNFTYLGYTEGEKGYPTLYFKEGRYTQKHDDPENEGWHPVDQHYRGANIFRKEWERYVKMREGKDQSGKNAFKAAFMKGTYDSNESDAKYFECSSADGVSWIGHPSRSRFIEAGSHGCNPLYDAAYAMSILEKGKIADNAK